MTDPDFSIRPATLEDASGISQVIQRLAVHFLIHPDGQGAQTVLHSITPTGISEFIANPRFRHWVALAQGQVIAVAGLRDNSHLYHLFVAPEWQGRGVGRALWKTVASTALAAGNPGSFTVNSTLYGRQVYERFGFTATGPVVQSDGIIYLPMALQRPS